MADSNTADDGREKEVKTLVFHPFAYALLDDQLSNYCWQCLGHCETLKKCGACKRALFCDKNCLAIGWKDHRAECKALKKSEHVPDIEVRLLGRIVTRHKAIEAGKDKAEDFYEQRWSKRKVMEIWSHTEDMRQDPSAWKKFEAIYVELSEFYPRKELLDKEAIFELHCRNYINRHAISDKAYLREIGKGLYLDLCAYDHSCRPNAIYTCDGIVATLRPLSLNVSIEDKSSTFYSYIDMLSSKEHRRKMLKDSWYFECRCERCLDPSEHVLTSFRCEHCSKPVNLYGPEKKITCQFCKTPSSEPKIATAIATMRSLDRLLDGDDIENSPNPYEYVTNLLEQTRTVLLPCNIYYVRLVQAALRHADRNDTKKVLAHHLEATEGMRICYPRNHPALAYHIMNIGIFYVQLNQFDEAKIYLQESMEMLEFALGKEHPMTDTAREFLEMCSPPAESPAE